VDGPAVAVDGPAGADLETYIDRPLAPADPDAMAAVREGPMAAGDALPLTELDRLLDPAPLRAENGWCTLPGGIGYVAIRTPMPGVSGEMVDWWFDWHPDDPVRYRIWHPPAHESNSIDRPARAGAKPHWDTVHHPIEDVGIGMVRARIEFRRPTEIGFSTDALDDPAIATIACGFAGDETRRMRHTVMAHVFLTAADGVILRSRFWLGAAIRPYLPAPLAEPIGALLGNRMVRRLAMPAGLPRALANHCAEEYANLASLLPELYARFARG
jgi:hypothetical protein